MSRRRPRSFNQLIVITIVAAVLYLLLRHHTGTASGYIATAFGGVLVGLYLPLWTDRAGRRTRTRVGRWGWWR